MNGRTTRDHGHGIRVRGAAAMEPADERRDDVTSRWVGLDWGVAALEPAHERRTTTNYLLDILMPNLPRRSRRRPAG
jgi:hypothetical protein